jgi:hypothetical protein
MVMAQVTTPNLQLQLPPRGTTNYDVILNNNFSIIDAAIGVLQNAYQGSWSGAISYSKAQEVSYLGNVYLSLISSNFNNIPTSSPAAWLQLFQSAGTVTSISDAPPLFTVTNRTTSPGFVFSNAAANSVWAGPVNGSAGPPGYRLLVAADIPSTLISSITGNANTASSFQFTPTTCSAGSYARGVDIFGNATGCTTATGSGPTTFTPVTHQFLTGFNSGTNTFSGAQPLFTDISGTATTAQLPSPIAYTRQVNTYTAGSKQTFASNTTTAGMGHTGVATDPSSLANGDSWYRTDTGRLMIRAAGISQQVAHISDIPTPVVASPTNSNVTPVTVSGTTSETSLQTVTTKAGELNEVGKWINVIFRGTYTTGATPGTLIIKVKNGTTQMIATSAVTLSASQTNSAFKFSCDIMTKTTGATGTSEIQCDSLYNGTSTNGWAVTAPVTSDLTGAVVLTVTATFSQTTSAITSRIMGYESNN